ncbi:MAG: phosphogluconate dehydratase [Proteobacteria bacterium]|nr:phosphogluconate dehydratase [Pseudomonadota bacterium]
MAEIHPVIKDITARIAARSRSSRADYRRRMDAARTQGRARGHLDCGNLAHACAAAPDADKGALLHGAINIGIVSAYNDMLSAHQPLAAYPDIIKQAARAVGATAQVAGGVPAMCDGVTQGQPGMELSLLSRDVIALATAVSLSHNTFDAALCLGVCDKIVPGLLIGALAFGHLPVLFVPAGPMPSGLPNKEKARVREAFARGEASRDDLLAAESRSYHGPGTCTFFGTANSNQMLMEIMGLHMPGSAFVQPGSALREALTRAAATRVSALAQDGRAALADVIDARAIVNGVVGLMATGGSTNHTLHLPAIARAAGIRLEWEDMDAISRVTPLLARIYPNGAADVNHFHAAGGMGFLIRELLEAGLLHGDAITAGGESLRDYAREPFLDDGRLAWREAPDRSLDPNVLRGRDDPFQSDGGLKLLCGNLGRAVMKTSALAPQHRAMEAPARIFHSQDEFLQAFRNGELHRDVIAVVRFQGPKANGMPELHKLTPPLAVLQDKGFTVGLVSDGRMSGASGRIPAAIHLTPEAQDGGPIARLRDGDIIRIDGNTGTLGVQMADEHLMRRPPATGGAAAQGSGRELFAALRAGLSNADRGASIFGSVA